MRIFFCFISLLMFCNLLHSAKILLVPEDDTEHIRSFAALSSALVEAGHDAWTLTSSRHIELLGSLRMTHILYETNSLSQINGLEQVQSENPSFYYYLSFFGRLCNMQSRICDDMENSKIIEDLKVKNFTYAIFDGAREAKCLKKIASSLNLRFSLFHSDFNSVDYIHYPVIILQNLSMLQKLIGISQNILLKFLFMSNSKEPEKTSDLEDLHFVNTDITCCLKYHSQSSSIIQVNHLVLPARTLTESSKIKKFLELTKGKIIVAAFKRNLLKKELQTILNVFKTNQELSLIIEYSNIKNIQKLDLPKNIFLSKRLPLNDIFYSNENITAFLTIDCLYYNQMATYYGIPSIFISKEFITYNSIKEYYETNHIIVLQKLESDLLIKSLDIIVKNESYRNSANTCSRKMHAMPSPNKMTSFWIDHVIEFGSQHLRKKNKESINNYFYSEKLPIFIFQFDIFEYGFSLLVFILLTFISHLFIKLTTFIINLITEINFSNSTKIINQPNNKKYSHEKSKSENLNGAHNIKQNLANKKKKKKKLS